MPAEAGTQTGSTAKVEADRAERPAEMSALHVDWIPAFAGMTVDCVGVLETLLKLSVSGAGHAVVAGPAERGARARNGKALFAS